MAKHLIEAAHAILAAAPDRAYFGAEEAARESAAHQSGAAQAIPDGYANIMAARGYIDQIETLAAQNRRPPDPVEHAAAVAKLKRAEVAHANAGPAATAATKISVARRKTADACVELLNRLALSGAKGAEWYRPRLPKGDLAKAIEAERSQRSADRAELRSTHLAESTEEEDLATLEAQIAPLEAAGAKQPAIEWLDGKPVPRFSTRAINAEPDQPGRIAVQVDAIPFIVSLFPDIVRERAFRQVREHHANTPDVFRLSAREKARRIADLVARIDASARLDCACVVALAGDAPAIHFPPDASAEAVLGIRLTR